MALNDSGVKHIDFDAMPAAAPSDAGSHIDFDAVTQTSPKPVDHINFDDNAPSPESSAAGAFARGVGYNIGPAIVGAAGAVGGAVVGAPAGPAGVIAGDVGGAIAGTALGEKIQRTLVGEKTAMEMDAQEAADREAHPIASGIGSMIGSVPLMLTGGGIPTAIARSGLKRAGTAVTKEALAVAKSEVEKRVLPNIARSAATFAGMSGGEAAAEKVKGAPGTEDISIANEAIKGAVGGAVMGGAGQVIGKFVPLAKTYLGGIGIRAPTDAMILAVSNGLYDQAVNGKPFDPVETFKQGGESIPAFMLMNAAMGRRGGIAPKVDVKPPEPKLLRSGRYDMPSLNNMSEAQVITLAQEYGMETHNKSAAQLRNELFTGHKIQLDKTIQDAPEVDVRNPPFENRVMGTRNLLPQRTFIAPDRMTDVQIYTLAQEHGWDTSNTTAQKLREKMMTGQEFTPVESRADRLLNAPEPASDAINRGKPDVAHTRLIEDLEGHTTRELGILYHAVTGKSPEGLNHPELKQALLSQWGRSSQAEVTPPDSISRPDAGPARSQVGRSTVSPAQGENSFPEPPTVAHLKDPNAPAKAGGAISSTPAPANNSPSQAKPDGALAEARDVALKAHEAATSPLNGLPEPTQAQKDAGNYPKGHIKVHGLNIAIENPAGSKRRPEWNPLEDHYGYIKGTIGKDKDHVDVFVNRDNPQSDKVFVVNQVDTKTGKFDEHKVVMGANSAEEAKAIYQRNYQAGWSGGDSVAEMTVDQFKKWVKSPATGKPAEVNHTAESNKSLGKLRFENASKRYEASKKTFEGFRESFKNGGLTPAGMKRENKMFAKEQEIFDKAQKEYAKSQRTPRKPMSDETRKKLSDAWWARKHKEEWDEAEAESREIDVRMGEIAKEGSIIPTDSYVTYSGDKNNGDWSVVAVEKPNSLKNLNRNGLNYQILNHETGDILTVSGKELSPLEEVGGKHELAGDPLESKSGVVVGGKTPEKGKGHDDTGRPAGSGENSSGSTKGSTGLKPKQAQLFGEDEGGFTLAGEKTADGERIIRERETKEKAAADLVKGNGTLDLEGKKLSEPSTKVEDVKPSISLTEAANRGTLEPLPQGRGTPLLRIEATNEKGQKATVTAKDAETLKDGGPYKSIRVLDTKGNDVTAKYPLKVKEVPPPSSDGAKTKFREIFSDAPAPLRRDADKLLRRMLGPNYSLDQVDSLMAGGVERLGQYFNKVLTVSGKGDQNRTFFHEAWHGLRDVLNREENEKIDRIEPDHEKQADAFMEYAAKHGEGFTGHLKRYFDRAWFRLKQLFGTANGADELKAMHAKLLDGVYADRTVGETTATEPAFRTLDTLRDEVKDLPKRGLSLSDSKNNPLDLSKKISDAKDSVLSAVDALKAAGRVTREAFIGLPKATDWQKAIGEWSYQLQTASRSAHEFANDIRRVLPDQRTSEAISNYIDAGGDMSVLKRSAVEAPERYKRGYHDAMKLTPEQKVFADKVSKYYEEQGNTAVREGWMSDVIENYINRTFEKDTPWKKGVMAEIGAGNIASGKAGFLKKRFNQYNIDAEKAGVRTVKDVRQQLLAYDWAFAKTMADRAFVKSAMGMTMPDGRPRFDVSGSGSRIVDETTGEQDATLVKPFTKRADKNDPANNRADYVALDHPAFRKWKWASTDGEGKPVIVQGQMLVHPEALKDAKAFLGKSQISQVPILNTAMRISSTIKQTMLDLSGFHFVQIGVHGLEHRVNPFNLTKINITNPESTQAKLVKGGLMISDTRGHQQWSEGLSGGSGSLFRHLPIAGEYLQNWNDTLFKEFIPRMKMTMAEHAVERNRKVYAKEMASGKMSEDALYMLTANESNAAFGHLNYEMLGRSKTTQDLLRLTLLAPDFLEARGRFAAQALTQYGSEQRVALALGAATLYVAARVLNKTINDEYHLEPENAFSLVVKGRAYSLRTVQGDIMHMFTEPANFAFNRLNPVYGRTTIEFLTGRDAFGRKRDGLQQIGDLAKTATPISLRSQPEQRLIESFMNAFGFTNKRYSAVKDVYKMADEFRKKHSIAATPEVIYDPDNDPLHMLKVSLSLGDDSMAVDAYRKILSDGTKTRQQIIKYFQEYPNRAFTGSRLNDTKFRASLSEEEKKIYSDAVAERRNMSRNFYKVIRLASQTKAISERN